MWNRQDTVSEAVCYAARLVLTRQATPQQAAAMCGLSVTELQALLESIPQPRLQQVEHSPMSHAAHARIAETNSYKLRGARHNDDRSSSSNFLTQSPGWEGHTR